MPLPEGDFPNAVILAAIKRAELHSSRDEPGIGYSSVVAHLGLPMGPATGRKLRPRFREMEAAGLVTPVKKHGVVIYTATPRGKRLLNSVGCVALPESPQHRKWREARDAATASIEGLRDDLGRLLGEGAALLADEATDSEAWFAFGERLGSACSRVASATHCLREWAEPSDDTADIDKSLHRGRRNPRFWGS